MGLHMKNTDLYGNRPKECDAWKLWEVIPSCNRRYVGMDIHQ
jgi:hypothetical protein